MPNFSYTYTLTNGTSADASQVMQNFNDALNGVTDGTKDISVSAITAGGTATLNGNVNLGNASSDDLTVTASLASTLPIKTTFSYDIGANATGLRYLFLGSADSAARSTKIAGATIASAWTLTLPTSAGSARQYLITDGSGTTSWVSTKRSGIAADNLALSCSVAASALTIALKGADGNDPSSTNQVDVVFRNSTAATGTPLTATQTSATSLVISSGSTLGHDSNSQHIIYVYLMYISATSVELAVSSSLFDEGTRQSSTAEGGAGAADSGAVLYSTTARTDVPIRLIGRLRSTQATAGTWATAPSEASLFPFLRHAIVARYSTDVAQTIANNSATLIDFEDKGYDTRNAVTVGASWKFTSPEANYYSLSAHVKLDTPSASWTTGETLRLAVYKNGSLFTYLFDDEQTNASSSKLGCGGSTVIYLDATDYCDLRMTQVSGAGINLNGVAEGNWVSIHKIS